MASNQNKNITEAPVKNYANLLRQARFKDRTQNLQSGKSAPPPRAILQDNRIDTPRKEKEVAGKLHRARQALRTGHSALSSGKTMSKVETLKQAKKIAKLLDEQVPKNRTTVYIVIILLAATKDFMDIASIEIFSFIDWSIDLMIWGILFFFLWGKGTWKVRLALWFTGFFELMPFAGFMPTWTLCTIYAYFHESKRVREYKNQIEEVNKAIKGKK